MELKTHTHTNTPKFAFNFKRSMGPPVVDTFMDQVLSPALFVYLRDHTLIFLMEPNSD